MLETRDLMAVAGAVLPPTPIASPPATIAPEVQALATLSDGPKVAFVQFEPLTGRVLVSFSGDLAGYNKAVLTNPANYSFAPAKLFSTLPKTPQSRPRADVVLAPEFKVTGVELSTPVAPGMSQSLVVIINNNQPIRNGIYQFAINGEGITDLAGRQLDGQYNGVFPSGNGQPGNSFVSLLTVVNNTVLPAVPANPLPGPANPGSVVPTFVFFPTTQAIRTRYAPANRPGKFMLVGGNNITLAALSNQFFQGTFRPKVPVSQFVHDKLKK